MARPAEYTIRVVQMVRVVQMGKGIGILEWRAHWPHKIGWQIR